MEKQGDKRCVKLKELKYNLVGSQWIAYGGHPG